MTCKHFLSCLLLTAAVHATAQDHRFHIGAGYQRTRMVDQQASPLTYQSSEKTVSLGYHHTGRTGKFHAQLAGAIGNFSPAGVQHRQLYSPVHTAGGNSSMDSVALTGLLYNGRLTVGYARKISGETNSPVPSGGSYAGLSVNNQLFYTDNIVRAGWLNAATMNADYFRELIFSPKHVLGLKISVPLFGVNTRLPYHNSISSATPESDLKTFFRQGSRRASVLDFQNIYLGIQYQYALSKGLGIGVQYSGQWLRYTIERPVTLFQNNLGLSLSFL